jgi:hypothetical protein
MIETCEGGTEMRQASNGRGWPGVALAAAALLLALPAAAAVRYTATTKTSDGDRTTVTVEHDGPRLRAEYHDRGGMVGRGDYLITEDGGDTIYLVEPKKRRYTQLDLARISEIMGRVLQGIPGVFWVKIDEPKIEQLFEEEADPLLGLPTRHVRYLMTYRERSRVTLPSRRGANSTRDATWNQIVQDVWLTDAVAAPAFDFWLRDQLHSGYQDLDRLLEAEKRLLEGFPLRVEAVKVSSTRDLEHTRVRLSRDKTSVSQEFYLGSGKRDAEVEYERTVTEISDLETTDEPLPAERFRPPPGYVKVEPKKSR